MKIEDGRYYRTRDGRKVGPMEVGDNGIAMPASGEYTCVFADTGMGNYDREWAGDIIAEWEASPVRTVTRKEIVPGTYGRVVVGVPYEGRAAVSFDPFSANHLTSAELTAAIATLTTIRDALDEVA